MKFKFYLIKIWCWISNSNYWSYDAEPIYFKYQHSDKYELKSSRIYKKDDRRRTEWGNVHCFRDGTARGVDPYRDGTWYFANDERRIESLLKKEY